MTESSYPLHPPIPPVSKKNAPQFAGEQHREIGARAFDHGSTTYDDVRPGYPTEVIQLATGFKRIVDVGAGTGKLTALLEDAGHEILALDPSIDMLRVLHEAYPTVPAWQAVAEHTALANSSVDLVSCAQTWHWVDVPAAAAEFDRIIARDGAVLLVWNNLDTTIPWVHRLSRIMHAGDVLKPGFIPEVAAPWEISTTLRTTWEQEITPENIINLAHTRSYWLRSTPKIQQRVDNNLQWYLYEHLEFAPGKPVALPYRCDAFILTRQA